MFFAIIFCAAALIVCTGNEVKGAVAFVILICALLVFCEDLLATTLPFLLVSVFVTRMYDSYNVFIGYKYCIIPIVIALIFHFTVYRKKISIGPSFWGICAVAVAVTFGGLFKVSAADYFKAVNLYYVIGLGIGMVLIYLLIKSQFIKRDYYDINNKFLAVLYIMGAFAAFIVLRAYVVNINAIIEKKTILNYINSMFISTNNISTFLMFALPIPFYFSLRNKTHLISGYIFFLCLLLSGSRAAMLMGSVEFVLCLAYICIFDIKHRVLNCCISVATLSIVAYLLYRWIWFFGSTSIFSFNLNNEKRFDLFWRSVDDFKSNPVFGRGMTYVGNNDIYDPKMFAMNWYHLFPAQVIGSFGCLGVVSYLVSIFGRVAIILKKAEPYVWVLALSYAGIFLMTIVNPGEFCPVPYEMLTVMLFIFAEQGMSPKLKNLFKSREN